MPWISAAAARYELRDSARTELEDEKEGRSPRSFDYVPVTDAFVGGEPAVVEMAIARANELRPRMEKSLKLNDALQIGNYLNHAVAAHAGGAPIEPWLERVVSAKADQDPSTLVYRWIAESVLKGTAKPPQIKSKHAWLTQLVKLPPADALDLALTPDHPDWPLMSAFVLPLALLLDPEPSAILAHAMNGGHPERRGEVLYERTAARPDVETAVDEKDRTTWPGFDAIERKDEALLVYHYLGVRWEAPIVFQPDIDALPFLAHLDRSWTLVQEAVTADQWKAITADRDAKRDVHIIAFDPEQSLVAAGALENASKHYGITLKAQDYRKI